MRWTWSHLGKVANQSLLSNGTVAIKDCSRKMLREKLNRKCIFDVAPLWLCFSSLKVTFQKLNIFCWKTVEKVHVLLCLTCFIRQYNYGCIVITSLIEYNLAMFCKILSGSRQDISTNFYWNWHFENVVGWLCIYKKTKNDIRIGMTWAGIENWDFSCFTLQFQTYCFEYDMKIKIKSTFKAPV